MRGCVEGPLEARQCPAAALRAHPGATLWLDAGSSALLAAPPHRAHPAKFPGFVDLQVGCPPPGLHLVVASCGCLSDLGPASLCFAGTLFFLLGHALCPTAPRPARSATASTG